MTWKTATDAFAATLPNYESRLEQDRLATTIENALADQVHLLAQAGCGTGKSFAYLVPLIDRAVETRKPSVVATATKALQTQLAEKDLPFLTKIFPHLRFAVVKGRGNYVCLAKLNSPDAESVENIADIREELAAEDHSGDLDGFTTPIASYDRSKLAVVGDECPGKRSCPFGDVCLAEAAKERAQDAHIVVANHSVLLRDIMIKNLTDGKGSMLPMYGALAIDEAHELEDYTTGALGTEFGQRALERLGSDVAAFLRDKDADGGVRYAARVLFAKLDQVLGKRDSTKRLTDDLLADLADELVAVLKSLTDLRGELNAYVSEDDDRKMAKTRVLRRLQGTLNRVNQIIMTESDELVRWIERDEKRGVLLAYAPLHVGPWLAQNLWQYTPSILVSATLATDGSFDYIAGRLGLQGFEGFDAGTPFDFAAQSALYVPTPKSLGGTFPNEPKDPSWQSRVIAESGELIRAAGGRTLLLFTSRRSMNETHESLLPLLRGMGVTVLKQGDAPNGQLSKTFQDDETSVLFALKSFMTGADFQGPTCSQVIIDKMPFSVPTDVVFQARAEAIDAVATTWQTKSFMQLSVPAMTLTLLQAFGRAIRTKTDNALVVIFDPRLATKSYGKGILRTLPDARRVGTLDEAREYLTWLGLAA